MKIIKEGVLRPRHFTCHICGCEFIADPDEYTVTAVCVNAIDTIRFFDAECPMCRMMVGNSKEVEQNK